MRQWIRIGIASWAALLVIGCSDSDPTVQDVLVTGDCTGPCWQGVQPGITTHEELLATLERLGIDYEGTPTSNPEEYNYYTFFTQSLFDPSEQGLFSIFVSDYMVDYILMPADVCISTLIEEYGMAPGIDESSIGHPDVLVYADRRFKVEVNPNDSTRVSSIVLFSEHAIEGERLMGSPVDWEQVKERYQGECHDMFSP